MNDYTAKISLGSDDWIWCRFSSGKFHQTCSIICILEQFWNYSKAWRCTFFGEWKNSCSSNSCNLFYLIGWKARWSKNRAAQGFYYINSFSSNIFGPNSKTCTCKVRAAWGRVSQGLTVFDWVLSISWDKKWQKRADIIYQYSLTWLDFNTWYLQDKFKITFQGPRQQKHGKKTMKNMGCTGSKTSNCIEVLSRVYG